MTFCISSRHGLRQSNAQRKNKRSCHFTIIYLESGRNFHFVCLGHTHTHTQIQTDTQLENTLLSVGIYIESIPCIYEKYPPKKPTYSQNKEKRICIINSKTIFNLMVVNLSSLLWLLFVRSLFRYSKYSERKRALETTYLSYVRSFRLFGRSHSSCTCTHSELGLIV